MVSTVEESSVPFYARVFKNSRDVDHGRRIRSGTGAVIIDRARYGQILVQQLAEVAVIHPDCRTSTNCKNDSSKGVCIAGRRTGLEDSNVPKQEVP